MYVHTLLLYVMCILIYTYTYYLCSIVHGNIYIVNMYMYIMYVDIWKVRVSKFCSNLIEITCYVHRNYVCSPQDFRFSQPLSIKLLS